MIKFVSALLFVRKFDFGDTFGDIFGDTFADDFGDTFGVLTFDDFNEETVDDLDDYNKETVDDLRVTVGDISLVF